MNSSYFNLHLAATLAISAAFAGGCGDTTAIPPVAMPAMEGAKPSAQLTPAVEKSTVSVTKAVARPAATHTLTNFSEADYDRHIEGLKSKLGEEQFTILVQPPFVVIGDEPADRVQDRAVKTVKWAVDRLKEIYFERDPQFIIDIWLFADKDSYEEHAEKLFGVKPHTPYGYYSPQHRALVMNIATGGGTLVHEIVHPFVAANFSECPSWFNEGLASLYEQSGEEHGKIAGYVNWRLTGLQQTIRAGRLPTFEDLCSTTTDQFYNHDLGANYGQARYLCLYLQEHDLLAKFYRHFHDNVKTDPTGCKTLQAVLSERDMADFQKRWETWVLTLRPN